MIYLIDKPHGWTSFDLVKKVRNLTGEKKVGHAGTLDPLATGLMILATGKETKKLHELTGLDKTYVAEILLGRATDTIDQEGQVIAECAVKLDEAFETKIQNVIKNMEGVFKLKVPVYSAVKINGTPLYKYARQNKLDQVEIPSRKMIVRDMNLLSIKQFIDDKILIKFEVSVASGVYIRSLAIKIGKDLGIPSMLWTLRRTIIGSNKIEDSMTIDHLAKTIKDLV